LRFSGGCLQLRVLQLCGHDPHLHFGWAQVAGLNGIAIETVGHTHLFVRIQQCVNDYVSAQIEYSFEPESMVSKFALGAQHVFGLGYLPRADATLRIIHPGNLRTVGSKLSRIGPNEEAAGRFHSRLKKPPSMMTSAANFSDHESQEHEVRPRFSEGVGGHGKL
jgi:hypothetical protein